MNGTEPIYHPGVGTRIETDRLVVRSFEPDDAEAWVAMVNDPEVRRYLPPFPEVTVTSFQLALEARESAEREVGYGLWAVEDRATGSFIGQCGIRRIEEGSEPEIEIAYHYIPASWNKGIGTEAVVAVLDHAFGPLGLDRVIAVAMKENVGSWRVMEKAGMRYEGLADYFGLEQLKKYVAAREWWRPSPMAP